MSQPLLAFNEVDVFYGPIQALKQVSLTVNEGETVALIGANGAGKSTLLMSVFGQPRIAGGEIFYRGEAISRKSTGARRCRVIRIDSRASESLPPETQTRTVSPFSIML